MYRGNKGRLPMRLLRGHNVRIFPKKRRLLSIPTRSFAWSLLVVCGVLVASAQVSILAAEVQTNRMRVE